ncbi:MAG: SAM-dependent methyltransferase [Candidatus Methanoplasma sp.]|jgi:tRNA1(Val) A37 N6-methylase TrmN6|nr:SAM-dependent methyltransferase [Candidatus Methanoplasma sp.]
MMSDDIGKLTSLYDGNGIKGVHVLEGSLVSVFLIQNAIAPIGDLILDSIKHGDALLEDRILKSGIEVTPKLIEHVMERQIDEDKKRKNGVVFTPDYISDYILTDVLARAPNESSTIIDPACGAGAFLTIATEKLSKKLKQKAIHTISNNIYGIDIDEENVKNCKLLLSLLILAEGENPDRCRFNIACADSLKEDWTKIFDVGPFDYVVGNPPYVNPHDLDPEVAAFLRNNFETTHRGTANIFYAFVEKSLRHLSEQGEFGMILPNNYLTITAAEELRKTLVDGRYIKKIVDFGDNMIFSPVRAYSSLLFLNKKSGEQFQYAVMKNTDDIPRVLLELEFNEHRVEMLDSKGWKLVDHGTLLNIRRIEKAGVPIKDYIHTGLATLRDDIYFIDGRGPGGNYYKMFNGIKYLIEPEILRDVYKISNIKSEAFLSDAQQKIIFPYISKTQLDLAGRAIKNTNILVSETELRDKYPLCYGYLCARRGELGQRDKGKPGKEGWYAYGRGQGIGYVNRKLLFPTFSNSPKFMLVNDENALFSNGYAIVGNDSMDIELLQLILNSKIMDYYISNTSYSIEGGYRCYQKKYLQNFSIPELTDREKIIIRDGNEHARNKFLTEKYNLVL